MEKLQAAIERARAQREGIAPPVRGTKPAPVRTAAWDALTPLETSPRHLRKHRVFVDPQDREAGSFDILRTKILQQCKENGWKRIVVTSPTKSCGKTTTCANLATSFARQSDRRVVLIDLDMRRPELGRVFGIQGEHGFGHVLGGTAEFETQAVRLGPNVAISANIAPSPNPSKLILQDQTPQILDRIEATYQPDLMILDTPPVLVTDDTIAILKHVDCALIVIAAETTTTDQVDRCEKEVAEHANVLGVVLNKCLYGNDSYGYDYAY